LGFIGFIAQDTMDRLGLERRVLKLGRVRVHAIAEDALSRCRRYFFDNADHARRIELWNGCDQAHTAVTHSMALMQVLINCVKNSIDAISTRRCRGVGRWGVVRLISGVYPERHGHFLSLSICDDGGGSPRRSWTSSVAADDY
jgi:nitrogen fixation/metabolism regulation signal transduction histidine kinase